MEKLLEIRIGGGRVESGLLPVNAVELMEKLIAALIEQGGDMDLWRIANAHVKIIGADSTKAAIYVENAAKLRPCVVRFRRNARQYRLGPKGREFVRQTTTQTWDYTEVIEENPKPGAKVLHFDTRYQRELEKRAVTSVIAGNDEIYATVIRAGGEHPTAKLELLNGVSGTYTVSDRKLAKVLGGHLYELVKLKVQVKWNRHTLKVEDLTVLGIDAGWKDVHLADVVAEYGGKLPMEFDHASVEEFAAARQQERDEEE